MNLGENIYNAFDIVQKTYANVNKLMDYCKAIINEKNDFVLSTPKFLRYKSDNDIFGWSIQNFIMIFQHAEDELLGNKWRNGAVYVLEISLYDPDAYDIPMVNIARYDYKDIKGWSEGCSMSNHWIFNHPLYSDELEWIDGIDSNTYIGIVKYKELADKKWWGLRKITGLSVPLTSITIDNAYDTIFGGFLSLRNGMVK